MISRALSTVLISLAISAPGVALEIRQARDLGGLEARSAALILSGQEGGDLPVDVLTIPMPVSSGRVRVALIVDIGAIPSPEGEGPTPIEIYAYALEGNNQIAAFLTQVLVLEQGVSSPIKFFGDLVLAPGSYSLQVLVRHRSSGRYGLRRIALSLPSDESFLLPPILHDNASSILFAQARTEASLDFAPFPEIEEGSSLLPTARALSGSDRGIVFFLAGRGLSGSPTIRLLDGKRQVVEQISSIDLDPATESDGLEWRRAELDGSDLENLASGQYFLEASVGENAGTVVTSFAVSSIGKNPEVAQSPIVGRRPKANFDEIARQYSGVLRLLSQGQKNRASSSLTDLESSFLLQARSKDQDRLVQTFLDVAESIGAVSAKALLPILALHEELYRKHHPARRYQLATQARRMVEGLTKLYSDSSAPHAGEGRALASLAGHLQAFDSTAAARVQFESALRYDPNLLAALLGLATLNEAYGDYGAAVPNLENALEQRPDSDEIALRLAINLSRLGRDRGAQALFLKTIESRSQWIRVVSAQELARLHLRSRKPEAAVRVLNQALEAQPGHPRLQIQLAAALDRSGRPGEARAVLSGLDTRLGNETDSARLTYSQWPLWAVEEAREGLARDARAEADDLSRVLDRLGTEENP